MTTCAFTGSWRRRWIELWVALALFASLSAACAETAHRRESIAETATGTLPTALWVDATDELLPATAEWTNKVELADIDGDGRIDLLFANGGNYSEAGEPELNRAFANRGPGQPFEEVTARVFGSTPDLARVIKARDLDGDGDADIFVGATYQTQEPVFWGWEAEFGANATHLPAPPQPRRRRAR